jgi:hypothetical protein
MKRVEAKEGIIWILAGGVICVLSWQIGLGSFQEPGAGFVAFAAGISLVGIGLIMILSKALAGGPANKDPGAHRPPLAVRKFRLVYTVLVLAGYGLVLQTLGYIATTFLAMFGLFFDRGTNRFLPSVLASLLTVVLTYLIFGAWLRVQLPRGIFPWW